MSDTESKSSDLTAECKTTLCMNCAALEAERDRLKEDIEKLIWNLAGCSTFALGYDLDKPFDKTMARAALYDTLACAKDRNRLTQEVEKLKAELEKMTEDRERWADSACRLEPSRDAWKSRAEKLAEAIKGMRHMMYGLSLDLRQAQIAQKAIDIAKEVLAEFEREGNK